MYIFEIDSGIDKFFYELQLIFNSIVIESFASPKEIENLFGNFNKFSSLKLNKKDYDNIIRNNILYKKLNYYEKYQSLIISKIRNFKLENIKIYDYDI